MSMPTRALLTTVGFVERWGAMTDQDPAYEYDFGNLQLVAAQVANRFFVPAFLLHGVLRSERSSVDIQFEMPLEIESYEQGVAWLWFGLSKGVGLLHTPEWLQRGRELQECLPWVRRQKAYEERPQFNVGRDWFKIAAKKLREVAGSAREDAVATFDFDGNVLRILADGLTLTMPAEGRAWPAPISIRAASLDHLPKRFANEVLHFSVWDDNLIVGNRAWKIVRPASDSKATE